MTPRTFAIPAAGMGFALTSGCTSADSIVGTWDLTTLTLDGDTMELPYVYTYENYTSTQAFELQIDEDNTGSFTIFITYTDGTTTDSYSFSEDATVENGPGRTYDLEVGGDIDLTASCTVSGSDLSCDGISDGDPIAFEAVAAE